MSTTIKEGNVPVALVLKYKGVFDYNKLSTFLIRWLQDRKFEINEGKHKHKMSCPHGFEIEREIIGERKIDDYYMHKVKIGMHLWDAFEVDAVKNGRKVKLWDARMELQLGFIIELDYAGKWEGKPFIEKLRNFYNEYVIKKEIIIKHSDPMYYQCLSLHTKIKELLKMETATKFR